MSNPDPRLAFMRGLGDPIAGAYGVIAGVDERVSALERSSMNVPGKQAVSELDANRAAAWQGVTFQTGYGQLGAPYPSVAYYKDTFGRVYMRGQLKMPAVANYDDLAFTLPAGYRPVGVHEFVVMSGLSESTPMSASIAVNTSGQVLFRPVGPQPESVPLDIVQFRTL